MSDIERDKFILKITAFGEAGGEGQQGIRAQIQSVVNRHNAGKWYSGKTLSSCCLYAYAFSFWNSSEPARLRAFETSSQDQTMMLCATEVDTVLGGSAADLTNGATHYYKQGSPIPDWVTGINSKTGERAAPDAVFTVQIGKHLFYKGVA